METTPGRPPRPDNDAVNPYRPPLAELGSANRLFVPEPLTSVGGALAAGLGLYLRNFGMIAVLTLVIYLPIELGKNWVLYAKPVDDLFAVRIDMIVGGVVGAFLSPAMIFAVVEPYRIGRPASVLAALGYGLRRWTETFGANFISSIYILLAALLLVVPGIVVGLWYVYVAEVVALEPRPAGGPLVRSKEITAGFRWRILGTFALVFALYLGFAFAAGLALAFIDNWLVATATDLVLDLAYPVMSLTALSMYVSIVHGQSRDPTWVQRVRWAPAPATVVEPAIGAALPPLLHGDEPTRPPKTDGA